jgi:hypothetical protein
MFRSAFLALSTALILIVALGWQNIMSTSWGQLSISWDTLSTYYEEDPAKFSGVITDESQLKPLIPQMITAGISLANAPYPQTQTEIARLTTSNRECEGTKANLDKTSFFLRSNLYEPLDPIVVYHDRGASVPPNLALFFQEYGYGSHGLTTNALGERTTVPTTELPRKVIVAGGAVAFSAPLDDANTLASRLQARDGARQYVTLAVPQGPAEQVICNLSKEVPRYRGQIDELIYVYAEEDLDSGRKYGTPEEVIAWLKNLALTESIARTTIIYAPTIYNVAPQLTRTKGNLSERIPNRDAQKDRLSKIAAGAGFGWFDIGQIVSEANKAQAAPFSILTNFADDSNLSLEGMNHLVDRLKPPPKPAPVLASTTPQASQQQPPPPVKNPALERRLAKLTEALEDIQAAAGRAAKNNRLKHQVGDILSKLKEELAGEP